MVSSFFTNIYDDFEIFGQQHQKKGCLLGIDYGKKRCGLAITDASSRIANAYGVVDYKKFSYVYEQLQKILERDQIVGLVIGLPKNSDNTEGPMAQSARQFARNLVKKNVRLPILMIDERLSSQFIDRMLIKEADVSREKRQNLRDKLSACFLLQAYCDWLHQH